MAHLVLLLLQGPGHEQDSRLLERLPDGRYPQGHVRGQRVLALRHAGTAQRHGLGDHGWPGTGHPPAERLDLLQGRYS